MGGDLASEVINITSRFHLKLMLRKRGAVPTLVDIYAVALLNTQSSSNSLRY